MEQTPQPKIPPKRWIFFGASTMGMLFRKSKLRGEMIKAEQMQQACPSDLTCKYHFCLGLCEMNGHYNFPPISKEEWVRPNVTIGGGPNVYGLAHPICHDAAAATSRYMIYSRTNTKTQL